MALTLDPITVKTDLAENYLKKFNNFDAFPATGKFWFVKNYPHDIIEHIVPNYPPYDTNPLTSYTARKLVEKIREHESTFYQLEYLIRKTDKTDFENYFCLMNQHLQCDDDSWNLGFVNQINIFMDEKTPLYALGCVAARKSRIIKLNLVSNQKMAPICHLFINLCSQSGLNINLVFTDDVKTYSTDVINSSACSVYIGDKVRFGCTGVVTESADIDSALDVFINSTVTAPWQFERIYVQESVYEEVKEALAARCEPLVVPCCGEAYAARGKVFACEALGAEGGVRVEAYRTARELCALLQQQPAPALSLWAGDSQLAHEAALAAPASLVWINEYATFHGPPTSSTPLYKPLYSEFKYSVNEIRLREMKARWVDWNKLTKKERVDLIMNSLRDLATVPVGYGSVDDFLNDVLNVRDGSFVSVDGGEICFGVERPPLFEDNYFDDDKPIKCIFAAINGMAILYREGENNSKHPELFKLLEKAGAPLACADGSGTVALVAKSVIYKTLKVVRSNFGTIFAN